MNDMKKLVLFKEENISLYSRVNKLCKNFSPSFLAIEKRSEYPFYTLCLPVSTNPKVSEQLNCKGEKLL